MTTWGVTYFAASPLTGEENEIWILRRGTESGGAEGAWVCSAITPEEAEAGEVPGDPTWVLMEDIRVVAE